MTTITVFGATKILKRNPWLKINRYLVEPGKEFILAEPHAWTGKGNLDKAPKGVQAVAKIFKYVADQLDDITAKARVEIIRKVMEKVDTETPTSKEELDRMIEKAKSDVAATIGLEPKMKRAERAALKKERSERIPTYEKLVKALKV